MKRALCLWLPHWPLQRLAARGEHSLRAVLLYERHASRGARVVAYCPQLSRAAAAPWEDGQGGTGVSPVSNLNKEHWQDASATQATAHPPRTAGEGHRDSPSLARRASVSSQSPPPASSLQPPAYLQSPASSHAGIRPGMPLAEATALADYAHADPPHLELHDPAADRLALAALAEWCQRFSPSVGVEEGDRPESLLLDVTGLGRLCGGEWALVEHAVRAFHEERGLTVRAALADTYAAAWAVAHFGDLEVTGATGDTRDLLAALRVPRIVPPGKTWSALAPLHVAALRLPEETCSLLSDLGLRRIEQVAALDRSTLLARFGAGVLARLDQARGTAAEAIIAQAPPPECEFQRLFEYPTGRLETIHAALVQLIVQACAVLERQRRGVLRLGCRLETEQRRAQEFVVGLYRPSADARHLGELARLKLEALRCREPIAALQLKVLAADRLEYHQQAIFVDESVLYESPRELAALVDRLSNRLGAQAVLRPWLLAGAQPEFACQYQPLASLSARRKKKRRQQGGTGVSPVSASSKKEHWQDASATLPQVRPPASRLPPPASFVPGDRPLSLRTRPLRLAVMSVAPEGPPVRFRLAGCDHRIAHVWGPERIETGWWRGRCVRRDYFQVETGEGERFWLFRELHSGAWFLHGEFL